MKRLFLLGVVAMGAMIDARGFTVRVCPENHFTDQEAAWWTERADRMIVLSNAVTAAQGAQLDGVLVQEMAAAGTEMIVGVSSDRQFGPMLLVGMGGVFVEVFKDMAMAPCPV